MFKVITEPLQTLLEMTITVLLEMSILTLELMELNQLIISMLHLQLIVRRPIIQHQLIQRQLIQHQRQYILVLEVVSTTLTAMEIKVISVDNSM